MCHVRKHWNVTCFNLDHGSFAPSNCVAKPNFGKGHAGLDYSLNTHRGLPCLWGICRACLPGGLLAGVSQAAPPLASAALCPSPGGMQEEWRGITTALLCEPTGRCSWAEPTSSNLGINPQRIWTWNTAAALARFPLYSTENSCFLSHLTAMPLTLGGHLGLALGLAMSLIQPHPRTLSTPQRGPCLAVCSLCQGYFISLAMVMLPKPRDHIGVYFALLCFTLPGWEITGRSDLCSVVQFVTENTTEYISCSPQSGGSGELAANLACLHKHPMPSSVLLLFRIRCL